MIGMISLDFALRWDLCYRAMGGWSFGAMENCYLFFFDFIFLGYLGQGNEHVMFIWFSFLLSRFSR